MTDDEALALDYERTAQYFFHLAEVRFKLLGLLPIASGAAIALVPHEFSPVQSLALGILGLMVSVGILLYDQRNSQIYNSLIGRMNLIEASLGRPPMRGNKAIGGAFLDRPGKDRLRAVLGLRANHGLGLDLIYASSLAGWAFVIVDAVVSLLRAGVGMGWGVAYLVPAAAGILMFRHLRSIDAGSEWEGTPPVPIAERIDGPAGPTPPPAGSAGG